MTTFTIHKNYLHYATTVMLGVMVVVSLVRREIIIIFAGNNTKIIY